jgi:hypothetical protein
VAVSSDGVLDKGVGQEVEELAAGPEASGSAEVEGVVDLAVGSLGVAAAAVEALVVGVACSTWHPSFPVRRV